MRGHITKRGKDSYSIVISTGERDPETKKYKQHWETVRGTKKDAEKRLAELLNQIDKGLYIKPEKTTLAEYLERWLKDYVWPNLAPRTAEGYEHIIRRYIIPGLGKIQLAQLKPEHIQKYYANQLSIGGDKGIGLSPRTVRHHHMCLHSALKTAVKWELLIRNPLDAIDPPRCQKHEMHTLTEEAVHKVLEIANETPYFTLFYLALFTGLRRSELLALKWSAVDLIMCQLSVSRSLHVLSGGEIITRQTKTARSTRSVALSPSTVQVLKDHRDKQQAFKILAGSHLNNDDFIFTNIDGKPLLPNTITHNWIKIIRKAGLDGIRLHDARHTHASLMLKQGIHPKIVQERLGHSSIQVTLDTYSHVAPGLQQAAAKGFDELIVHK